MAGACVTNPRQLRRCLERMLSGHDAFAFPSASGELRLVLRPDPYEDDERAFQLCLRVDDGEASDGDDDEDGPPPKTKLQRALEGEYYGYFDEDVYVCGSYCLDDADDVDQALTDINRLHAAEVCKCGRHLIKDGARMCLFCQMTSMHDQPAEHTCAICMDRSIEAHFRKQPCCGQMLHKACWARCKSALCPLCRSRKGGSI